MTTTRSPRHYHTHWPRIAKRARRLTHDRCVWCLWRRAAEVHHARYRAMGRGLLAGREIPGWDVFPLCQSCHGLVHRKERWKTYRNHSWNHNIKPTHAALVLRWWVRRLPLEWMIILPVGTFLCWLVVGFM